MTPETIGVVGAGTMGAGIAQLAAQTGARTLVYDPQPGAADAAAGDSIEAAATLADLATCGLVIEAAPERLDLKLELFGALAQIVSPDAVLATNTSSLSVTEIAAGVPGPERVVGMHFFNPAPKMRLMEVVAGELTGDAAVATARAVGEAMGKHVIDAADIAGFLVNRVNRPFSLESLRLLEARVADVDTIDRIARMAGGFRMGPFQLMDLIGIETNHAVAEGFLRQTYGEPRYRPSALAARKIAAGHLGRKTGRGWYVYGEGSSRPVDPEPPAADGGDGRTVVIAGTLPVAEELRDRAEAAGFTLADTDPWLVLDLTDGSEPLPTGPLARSLHRGSLHLLDPTAAGFHAVAPLRGLVEVTSTPASDPVAVERLAELLACVGVHAEPVDDAPGLVLGRIVCQLINEAHFLIGEGNGTPDDVDAGLELGVNHPRGPVAWLELLGVDHVLAVLDALHAELGEE
ncbi:MAG TPA: 3-hydroxyacyl-CoA dehydrogenase NAD-binding domain-containing protein, partial [Solirubrobacteraceae bacterium]